MRAAMAPPYWLGVDGGGTKTAAVLLDGAGAERARATAGPSNIHTVGRERAARALREAIEGTLAQAGVQATAVRGIGLGIAGAARPDDRAAVRAMIAEIAPFRRVVLTHDAETALVGGIGRRHGAVLIAGTGAIAYGVNAQGHARRADGWGPLLGDAGSAYWIAREGLRAVARGLDRRGPATALQARLLAALELEDPEGLVARVYAAGQGPSDVAQLAPAVRQAADDGDAIARRILARAGRALARTLRAVVRGLDMREEAFEVVLAGGVLGTPGPVRACVLAALPGIAPHARGIAPRHDAAYGAALLARTRGAEE
ncbi:MAG: ATPase [Anaerolineae bacterium]|nr:ATPase [Anaerolineae bacterium]